MIDESVANGLAGILDDRSLCAPGADLSRAVTDFARARMTETAPLVGRLVCPASRLDELTEQGSALMPGTFATSGYREMAGAYALGGGEGHRWEVMAVIDGPIDEAIDAVGRFNHAHEREEGGLATVAAVEIAVDGPSDVEPIMGDVPDDLAAVIVVPRAHADDPRGVIAAAAGEQNALVGIVAEGPADTAIVAAFLTHARAAGVRAAVTAEADACPLADLVRLAADAAGGNDDHDGALTPALIGRARGLLVAVGCADRSGHAASLGG